jgi:hypothetical protein
VFPTGQGVADVFEAYLEPAGIGKVWNGRAAKMLAILGGTLDEKGALSNKAALVAAAAEQIEAFAEWYLINRLRQKERLDTDLLRKAGAHLTGSSGEVALLFIEALVRASQRARINIAASAPGPHPTPAGAVTARFETAIRAIEGGRGAMQKAKDGIKSAAEFLENVDLNPFH